MKRVVFLCSLLLICSAGQTLVCPDRGQTKVCPTIGVAFGQSVAGKACPFSIAGTWKVEGGTRTAKKNFYEFVPGGAVMIREYTADVLPQEYEEIGFVKYSLDRPEAPKRVEFTSVAMNSGTAIRRGKSSLLVVEYGDDSFVTSDPKTQALTRWFRVQTHRRFLTFVARSGPSPSAFVMWTTLDGHDPKIEALGLRTENQGRAAPIFGPIPDQLYRDFEVESRKASDTMFRLELTEAEFARSHKVFEAWAEIAKIGKLPHADPYLNGMEFLKSAAGNLNQCDVKLKLPATPAQNPQQQVFEYIKAMRNRNKDLHVADGVFSTDWRPMLFPDS